MARKGESRLQQRIQRRIRREFPKGPYNIKYKSKHKRRLSGELPWRSEMDKATRRVKDKRRRKNGSLKSWDYSKRVSYGNGHKSTLMNRARSRSKKSGMKFTIAAKDFEIPTHCPVLGIRLRTTKKSGPGDHSPTLDRIRNDKGYVPGNVEVISWRANRIKCDATFEELVLVGRYYGSKRRKSSSKTNTKKVKKRVC